MADKRLIDANAIPWEECFIPVESQRGWKFKRDESAYKSAIDQMPTVDAVEVVHGKWEWLGPYRYNGEGLIGTCSVCKERLRLFETKYCPNCGAKMDKKRRNTHE